MVLSPQVLGLRNRLRHMSHSDRLKLIATLLFIVAIWVGLYFGMQLLLKKLYGLEMIGPYLIDRLLNLLLLSFTGLLLLSGIVSSLGILYLSEDLALLHSLPISSLGLYYARFAQSLLASSWMVVIFGLPVLLAYAQVLNAKLSFYPLAVLSGLGFILIPSSLASVVTTILVNIFPARRARDILAVIGALFLGIAWFMFRAMRPEQLVNPEGFSNLTSFLASLSLPQQAYLPSTWASQALSAALRGDMSQAWSATTFLLLWGFSFLFLSAWFAQAFYRSGFSRAQQGRPRRLRGLHGQGYHQVSRTLTDMQSAALMLKDLRSLVRDPAQWGQMVLLVAMVAIYLFSIKALPFDALQGNTDIYRNAVAFMNIGMTAFVQAAVAVRFAFPSVSMEGRGMWILRTAPMQTSKILRAKWLSAVFPLLFFGEVLAVLSNILLNTDWTMMLLAIVNAAALGLVLCALAVGIGAIMPNFKADNPVKAAASFGGLLYMSAALLLIVLVLAVQAIPTSFILRAQHFSGVLDWHFALAALIAYPLPFILMWWLGRAILRHAAQSLAKMQL